MLKNTRADPVPRVTLVPGFGNPYMQTYDVVKEPTMLDIEERHTVAVVAAGQLWEIVKRTNACSHGS